MSRKSCARPAHPRDRWRGPLAAALMLLAAASPAAAQAPPPARQALEDAWWTGSLSAPSAATLPAGHMVIEPYLIDSRPYGRFDSHGTRGDVPREDDFGSLIIMNYGLTDRFTVGAIPHFGYRRPAQGRGSSGIGLGDLTLQAQYRLTQWRPGSLVPTLSVNLGESLPLGEHDRLGDRPADGFGSGAYATIASLYAQTYAWTPNGRILRTRLDLAYTISDRARLKDVSVYGTPQGFRGHADTGDGFNIDLAFEYSLTRNWVLALDLGYERDGAVQVSGRLPAGAAALDLQTRAPASRAFIVIPAVEYNFSPTVGVIVGAKIVPAGRNTTATVIPAIAFNYVR